MFYITAINLIGVTFYGGHPPPYEIKKEKYI